MQVSRTVKYYRAMRIFLGVHKYAPLLGIICDMGWPDFQTHKQLGRIRLWNRLIAMNDLINKANISI